MKKLAIAVSILLLGLISYSLFGPKPDDRDQILTALKDSIAASKEGRTGSVLELLSRNFKLNGEGINGSQVVSMINKYRPNISISNKNPDIDGDKAVIRSSAALEVSLPPLTLNLDRVSLNFERQQTFHWMIIPSHDWKLVSVSIPDDVMQQVMSSMN